MMKTKNGSKRSREEVHNNGRETEQSSNSSKRQRESESSQLQSTHPTPIDLNSVIDAAIASRMTVQWKTSKNICPVCDKRQKQDLLGHLLLHTDERPYLCDLCVYRAVRCDSMGRHLRNVHGKSPEDAKELVKAIGLKYVEENLMFSNNKSSNRPICFRTHEVVKETALRKCEMFPFSDPFVEENLTSMHFHFIRPSQQFLQPGPERVRNKSMRGPQPQHGLFSTNLQFHYGLVPYSSSSSSTSSSCSSTDQNRRLSELKEHNDRGQDNNDSIQSDCLQQAQINHTQAELNELENGIPQGLADYDDDVEMAPEIPTPLGPSNEAQSQLPNVSVSMEIEKNFSNRDNAEFSQMDFNMMEPGGSENNDEENEMPMNIDETESNVPQRGQQQAIQFENVTLGLESSLGETDTEGARQAVVNDLDLATSSDTAGKTIENREISNGNEELWGNLGQVPEPNHDQQQNIDSGEKLNAEPKAYPSTSQRGGAKIPSKPAEFHTKQSNLKENGTKLFPNVSKNLAAKSKRVHFAPTSFPGTTAHFRPNEQNGLAQCNLNEGTETTREENAQRIDCNLNQRSRRVRRRLSSPDRDGYFNFHRGKGPPLQAGVPKRLMQEIRNGEWERSVMSLRRVFVEAIVLSMCLAVAILWFLYSRL